MAVTLTTALKNINEDLANTISNIAPSATPVYTAIGKTKATNTYHENLIDTLAAPTKDNARTEGADAVVPSNAVVSRVGNWTQIFAKEVSVTGTVDGVSTAGAKSDFSRQLANVMKEIKTDIEASIVSGNASVSGTTRKLAGMEAWIKTNAVENGGSSTPGFAAGIVAAPVAGTPVVVTEAMFQTMTANLFNSGGEATDVICSAQMKQKLSSILSGNATKYNLGKEKAAYSNVDVYTTDFGTFYIKPHRMISQNTIIAYDPELWAVATLRGFKTEELARTGDARKVQLVTELTLEARNEAGNAKISGIKVA